MDARRLELYDLLKPTLGDEPARKLVLALPADPTELANRRELAQLATKQDLKDEIAAVKTEIAAVKGEIGTLGSDLRVRTTELDSRFGQMEAVLTRRMVAIMGGWTVTAVSLSAWASAMFGN